MYAILLRHYWKSLFRKTAWGAANLGLNAMAIFLGIYLILHCLALGFFADVIIKETHPGEDVVEVANRYMLALCGFMFFMRFLLQTFPHVRTRPYLHLPLSRTGLVHFFLAFTLSNFHNIYPLFLFVLFWIKNIAGVYSPPAAMCWMAGVVVLLACANYAVLALHLLIGRTLFWGLVVFLSLAGLAVLDKALGLRYIEVMSAGLFDGLLGSIGGAILLVLFFLAGGFYFVVFVALKEAVYLDAQSDREIRSRVGGDRRFAFLEKYGLVGHLMYLEVRMLWRKKRTKHVLFSSIFMAVLGFMYTMMPMYADGFIIRNFGFIILTGALTLNYGQFMFGWESRYYDGLLARDIAFGDMVKAKLFFLQISCVLLFLLTAPVFVVFAREQLGLYLSFLCYNLGFSCTLILLVATFNTKRLYLSQSAFANWEGTSIQHFILVLPLMLLPVLPMYLLDDPLAAASVIAGLGLASVLGQNLWIALLVRRLTMRKYKMAMGFRGIRI